ncbi:MAG: bifunctional 4-hydroxy-3-methylbut-2-enyl diphosphate reductase/30S ribosomal protein S1 [Peptococcaceae bacterium]|nr:bifunctional 4-hydroxy-3-methylbut-2-enyl diphosphate reductase/30S ribosomal protein S1 [Peptococcaceae bacterium]
MKEIIKAEKAGFCFGVKRAIDMAENAVLEGKTVTLGSLIHNQQVVDYLKSKGIKPVDSLEEIADGEQLVIRSHGVPPEIYRESQKRNIKLIDATCPYVQKAQKLAAELSKDNYVVIVVGDKDHPEVKGILGWAGENSLAINTIEQAKELPYIPSMAVLAQTTQHPGTFSEIVEELRKHTDNLIVHNTICKATEERQAAAQALAEKVDVMIVAGGRSSSNTRKLAAICSQKTPTYLIETAAEIQEIWFKDANCIGLTAGASTPDWIIEEVYTKMSEILEKANEALVEETPEVRKEDDVNTMENFEHELPSIYGGAIVNGTVVKITEDEVFVDIGWKSEGVIPREELTATQILNLNEAVKIGDKISAMVTRVENNEGYTVLSRKKVAEYEARERLAALAESKEEIQAKVTEVTKGGLLVDLGMRGFIPASQIEIGYAGDLNKYLGQTLRLRVIEYNPAKRKLILSQKVILEEEQAEKREQLLASLQEGDVVKGIVRRLTDFGAFVDLGGIDGLLHISDMAFSRINHPSEVVKVNDEVELQVLKVDRDKGRISLGLKQLKPDPWSNVEQKYPVGSIIQGKVVRIAPFGAFVQLEDAVDGLIHISQLADRRVAKVEDVVKVGEMISAKVIECKPEEKRISLSIREMIADAQKASDQEAMLNQPEDIKITIGDAIGNIEQDK